MPPSWTDLDRLFHYRWLCPTEPLRRSMSLDIVVPWQPLTRLLR
jgi:hypothetical protein